MSIIMSGEQEAELDGVEWMTQLFQEMSQKIDRQHLDTNNSIETIRNNTEQLKISGQQLGRSLVAMHQETQLALGQLRTQIATPSVGTSGENGSTTGSNGNGRNHNSNIMYTQATVLPTYRGDKTKHPMRYLEELESYLKRMNIPEEHYLETALEGLKGPAQDWKTIYCVAWTTYADFKKDFVACYWSELEQNQLRHQISTAMWKSSQDTMANHFAHYAGLARLFTNPIPEKTLVNEIMRHFPRNIQSLWLLVEHKTVTTASEFLRKQEGLEVNSDKPYVPPRPETSGAPFNKYYKPSATQPPTTNTNTSNPTVTPNKGATPAGNSKKSS